MSVSKSVIGVWDYMVIFAVLLISSGIGMYYRLTGGRQKTIKEYLLADKNMHMVPVAFSLVVSFMSAITILGISGETYTFGIQFLGLYVAFGLFTPVAAFLYLPVFFRLQAISSYEYLEKRFGKTCRLAASISYTVQTVLYIAVVLYAPALALEALTGLSKFVSIFTIGFVCVFYGSLGGMKAALMSDLFQLLLMFGAILSVIISGLNEPDGLGGIVEAATKGGRLDLPRFDPDPTIRHSWFSLIIGGGVNYLSIYIVTQTQIQRFLTLGHIRRAQKAIFLMWAVQFSLMLCLGFAGLAIYSKYHQCDPVTAKIISSQDQLMPYYVVDTMGHIPGLSGLFVAGIFSASLSSITGALNSLAAVIMEDYLKPMYLSWAGEELSDAKMTIRTKVLVLVLGTTCIGLAFLAQFLGGLLQACITIFGGMSGPLLGIFTLGMFVPAANEKGAVTGLIVGTMTSLWVGFGGPKPALRPLPLSTYGCNSSSVSQFNQSSTGFDIPLQNGSHYFWLYRLSYLYTGVIGVVSTILVGYIVSLVYDDSNESKVKQIDLRLFVTPVANHLRKKYKLSSNTTHEEQTNLMNIRRNNIVVTNERETNFENNN